MSGDLGHHMARCILRMCNCRRTAKGAKPLRVRVLLPTGDAEGQCQGRDILKYLNPGLEGTGEYIDVPGREI